MATGFPLLILLLLSLVFIVLTSTVFKLHPFLSLLLASVGLGLSSGMSLEKVIQIITGGFGSLMAGIGLVIVLGTIIGVIMEKTGAAERLAQFVLQLFGIKRLIPAVSVMGGLVGIPVFCDSGFIILSQLNKKLAQLSGKGRISLNLALAGGLYATHVLVPPTPGPLAAAGNLGAEDELGMVIIIGLICTIPALVVSGWWASRCKETIELSEDEITPPSSEQKHLPPLTTSLLPIFLPVLLIALASILKIMAVEGAISSTIIAIGNPNVALLIGVACAFLLFEKWDKTHVMDWIGKGLTQAGPILLITCAGGAFGAVIKETPVVALFQSLTQQGAISEIWLFPIIFLLAAGLKTSQGSSTASMVITSSMIAALLPVWGLTSSIDMALVVVVIGAGAMTVSHANDSYFWVVNNFGGMKMQQTYRTFTVATLLQGIVILLAAMGLKLIF